MVLAHLVDVEGYEVLVSESQPIPNGYILGSFPGMRGSEEENYTRMFKHFDRELIEEFNRGTDQAKRRATGNAGGGDPDLFAYRKRRRGDRRDHIFVEVKRKNEPLGDNQKAVFPVIRSVLKCEVWLYRIEKC